MSKATRIEREMFIVDSFISRMEENPSKVIYSETVEAMKESLQAIQDELAQGRCPDEWVESAITTLAKGQQALQRMIDRLSDENHMGPLRVANAISRLAKGEIDHDELLRLVKGTN